MKQKPSVLILRSLAALALSLACLIDLNLTFVEDRSPVFSVVSALPGNESLPAVIGIAVSLYLCITYCSKNHLWRENRIAKLIISLFFAFTMVFGWSFANYDSASILFQGGVQCVKFVINFLAWSIVSYLLLSVILNIGKNYKPKASAPLFTNKVALRLYSSFQKHPFLFPYLVLSVVWLPTYIGYFPGLFMGDTWIQIHMWFNLPNLHSSLLNLINPEITLAQHHPVLHTAILGICLQVGQFFGSDNIGIALYSFIQWETTIVAIAYSVKILTQEKCSFWIVVGIFTYFALVPVFSFYSVLVTKDSLFSAVLLVFISACWKTKKTKNPSACNWILICILALLVSLLRNGGVLFAVGGLAALVLTSPRFAKQVTISAVCMIVAFSSFTYVLLPSLEITPGSKREVLSIPFQQVARFAANHPEDISEDEKQAIDQILGYGDLSDRYDPIKADPVKDRYNENATSDQLNQFFKTWVSLGLKHPETYFAATANNYYGYFYLTDHNQGVYSKAWSETVMSRMSNEGRFAVYHPTNPIFQFLGRVDVFYYDFFKAAPILNTTLFPPLYSWILILATAFCVVNRKRGSLAFLIVPWLVLLVALIGPMNGLVYFRYVYPIALCMPFLIGLAISEKSSAG